MPKRATRPVVVAPDIEPMEAKSVAALPADTGWQFEPKWDGFRCVAWRSGQAVHLHAKSGKPLSRYFPEVIQALRSLPPRHFVLDGELCIPAGNSFSFDALQMRLHPADSRIRKLARETPAVLVLFDMLMTSAERSLLDAPLGERRTELEAFCKTLPKSAVLRLSPYTRDVAEARGWLDQAGEALDGVVAKRLEGKYESGVRAMLKVKRLRSADCVVGGFRYATDSDQVGSLLLGLYDEQGKLHHVGFTSSIPKATRKTLTRRLEKLIKPPGFTGNAPGSPSRWSTERSTEWQPLRPKLVVEVRYDHATGRRFRHGTKLLRWRPDKSPRQCTCEQLAPPARPGKAIATLLNRTG